MTNYLALIRKADFTDLFKYGKLHINNDMKTDFSCSIEELPSHPEIFFNLTRYANSFDSAFSYLMIHYIKTSSIGLSNDVNIEEVQNVYPLDYESKEALAMSFDERIRIENPIWPESVWNLQKQQQFNDCQKGASNLRKILGFTSSDQKCKSIVSDDIVREVVNELFEEKRPSGDLSIWVYLLRYERHSYYPQTTLGYFMDMVNIGCNRMGMKEVGEDDIKNTQIFRLLDSLRYKQSEAKFEQIYEFIFNKPDAQGFFNKIHEFESRIDFSKVATLFLILKNKYKDDFTYEEKFITCCKKIGFEFELAVYLLGIIKGHEHTYDCMYDILPLPIFKKAATSRKTNERGWDTLISQPNAHYVECPSNESIIIPSKLGDVDYGEHIKGSSGIKDSTEQASTEVVATTVQEPSLSVDSTGQAPTEVVTPNAQEPSVLEDSTEHEQTDVVVPTIQEQSTSEEDLMQVKDSSSQHSSDKDLFGEDTIQYPIYMRKPTGGRARVIKNEKDYKKKHYKNLLDGYTIESEK